VAAREKRKSAIWALGRIGPDAKDAVPVLREALPILGSPQFRATVAEALGGIGMGARAAVPALAAMVRDQEEDSSVRESAAKAIVKIDPEFAAKNAIETAWLSVRLGKIPSVKLLPRPAITEERKKQIRSLIRKLAETDHPDYGISATVYGYAFTPLPEQAHAAAGLIIDHKLKPSEAFRRLVEIGPEALPFLLEALEDTTPTKLTVKRFGAFVGGLGFENELDGNPLNRLEQRALAQKQQQDTAEDDWYAELPELYTVKVGDVCFVAVGQIVGRDYLAVHYVPTLSIVVYSPTRDKYLREQVRAIWSDPNPAKKVLESLLTDYATEGIYNGKTMNGWDQGSRFQVRAATRLLYYYPREAAPFIAARLRSFDVKKAADLDRREVKNGVRTDEFIKAISWSAAPEIQDALADIAKRTDDPDIKAALPQRQKRGG
jgi:hypothetical protein